jgi:hypothetical protein
MSGNLGMTDPFPTHTVRRWIGTPSCRACWPGCHRRNGRPPHATAESAGTAWHGCRGRSCRNGSRPEGGRSARSSGCAPRSACSSPAWLAWRNAGRPLRPAVRLRPLLRLPAAAGRHRLAARRLLGTALAAWSLVRHLDPPLAWMVSRYESPHAACGTSWTTQPWIQSNQNQEQ